MQLQTISIIPSKEKGTPLKHTNLNGVWQVITSIVYPLYR